MTRVRLNLARRLVGGEEVKPEGEVLLRPWRRETNATNVVLPAPFVVPLHRSMHEQPIADLDHRWLWHCEERVLGGTTQVVRIPESTSVIAYSTLEVINPRTLTVVDSSSNATTWMDEARAAIDAATAAAENAALAADRSEAAATRVEVRINMPPWVTTPIPCQFVRDKDQQVVHNMTFDRYLAPAYVLWVSDTGNDVTGTGTPAAPYRSIGKAWTEANERPGTRFVIRVTAGFLSRSHSPLSSTPMAPSKSIAIVGANETPTWVTTADVALTWTQDSPNTWSAPRSLVRSVWRINTLDSHGAPGPLRPVASLIDVRATANSWYTDGATVWVRTHNGQAPTTSSHAIVLALPLLRPTVPATSALYLENLNVLGGTETLITGPGEFVANRCRFIGGGDLRHQTATPTEHALVTNSTRRALLFDCVAAHAPRAGFVHHSSSPAPARAELALLYGCKAYGCGPTATTRDNSAYLSSGGVTVVRVGCDGWSCSGPILADTEAAHSVAVDCHMRDTTATPTQPSYKHDAGARVWLEGCLAGGTTSFDLLSLSPVDIKGGFGGHRITAPLINYHR